MSVHPVLKPYHWKNRVLIVLSDQSGLDNAEEQMEKFIRHQQDIIERDLVVLNPVKEMKKWQHKLTNQESEQLRSHFGLNKEGFYLLLIGKDGTVKRQYNSVTGMPEINKVIDAMPMRQREMEQRNEKQ